MQTTTTYGTCSLVFVCLLVSTCQAQRNSKPLREAVYQFENRDAWKLENEHLRVSILRGGGHIVEIVLKTAAGDSVNPLWVPPWPSIDPWTFDVDKHGSIYGTNSEATLLSGIMGHNLCFDFWGAPSEAEFQAGMSYHGEVSILTAEKVAQTESYLTHRLDLTQSGTAITRTMTLVPDQPVLYVAETAENHTSQDKPFGWVQHATFGPPFVNPETVYFDASATQGDLGEEEYKSLGTWPAGSAGEGLEHFRRFSREAPSSKMAYFLMDPERDPEFITALNTEYRLLIGYVFWRVEYPWMMVWEENRKTMTPPWNGETITRGMEFGNTRIPGSAKAYFKKPEMYGTPTFEWLDARDKLTKRYLAFMAEIPDGMTGVRDVELEGSEIVVKAKGVSATIRITYDPSRFPRP
jgi:hypothetical protein